MNRRRGPVPLLTCVLAAVVLTGCTATGPDEAAIAPIQPARAEAVSWPFRLVFELPSTTWHAGEPIEGRSMLELVEGDVVVYSGSGGGPLAFQFVEVGGRRKMEPAWTADCVPHQLTAGAPLTSPITKSGGFSADDPDAAFYRAFFEGPDVRLPPGEWEITAVASLTEGADCRGPAHDLRASIRILVTP